MSLPHVDLEHIPFDHAAQFTSTDPGQSDGYVTITSPAGYQIPVADRRKSDRRYNDQLIGRERERAHAEDIRSERVRANLFLVFGYILGLASALALLWATS